VQLQRCFTLYRKLPKQKFYIFGRSLSLWEPGWLSQYSVWLRTGLPGDRGLISGRGKMVCPLTSVSRQVLGPTQPPVQWVPAVLSPGGKARPRCDADHSLHLGPRSLMSRSYISSPPCASIGVLWDYFYLLLIAGPYIAVNVDGVRLSLNYGHQRAYCSSTR
jgi:hypothetical protein